MLGAGLFCRLLPLIRIPAVLAGMILPDMLLRMTIPECEQHAVIRMHFQMAHFILRVPGTEGSSNQLQQYGLRDLFGSAICFPPIVVCAANPYRHSIRRAPARDLPAISLAANPADHWNGHCQSRRFIGFPGITFFSSIASVHRRRVNSRAPAYLLLHSIKGCMVDDRLMILGHSILRELSTIGELFLLYMVIDIILL